MASGAAFERDFFDSEFFRTDLNESLHLRAGSFGFPPSDCGGLETSAGDVSNPEAMHDEGKCTPCKFQKSAKGCAKGQNCKFCHLPHQKKSRSRPSKPVRDECKRIKDMLVHTLLTGGTEAFAQAVARGRLDVEQNSYLLKLLHNVPVAQANLPSPAFQGKALAEDMIRQSSKSSSCTSTTASGTVSPYLEYPEESFTSDSNPSDLLRFPPGLQHVPTPGHLIQTPWLSQQEVPPGVEALWHTELFPPEGSLVPDTRLFKSQWHSSGLAQPMQ
eukprot:TRINITY_DN112937_c0_g1_i1.p1 TRINITY_DN112937_c0_g1~~TRINITY_DN112937_c0_g1_i1.p1  ORF type:complete len:273 (-),score=40.04 TRINITY_DN112937_c0_g1_i1:80-898(-)